MTRLPANLRSRSSITAWPSADQKAGFAALADSRGLSQSKLLGLFIEALLARSPIAQATGQVKGESSERDRITVRLRPGDGKLLRSRAKRRSMNYTTYVAALIRAHVRADPPMPIEELSVLERSLGEVSAISRSLSQLARAAREGQGADAGRLPELESIREALEQLRQSLREVVKANRISWESADAEAAS